MKNKILVFVATYNENLNISDLFFDIIKISPEYDVLIIDDNSTDGTKESLEKLSATHTCLTVINRPRKMGVGSAHRAAMIYALKINMRNWLLWMLIFHTHQTQSRKCWKS